VKYFTFVVAVAAAMTILMGTGLRADSITIQNFSFENPTLASGAFTDYGAEPNTILGWTNPNMAGVQHYSPDQYASVPDGVNGAFSDSTTPIAQILSAPLEVGTYTLTIAGGWRNGKNYDGGTFGLYTAGGTQLATQDFVAPTIQGTFVDSTLTFTVLPTNAFLSQDLQIEMAGRLTDLSNGTMDFDNVRLNFAAVPEPSTYAMIIGGMSLLLGLARVRPLVS
jgi:hypothetical protein